VRIVAHRACPLHGQENSIQGVITAAKLGADAVEIDIRLTSDGLPILNHDRTLWRMAKYPLPVDRISSSRFRTLRNRQTGTPMPSLTEVLDVLPDGLDMALDLKAPSALGPTVELLAQRNMLERAALWVRDPDHVRRAATLAPESERALLRNTMNPAKTSGYLHDAVACGATAVSIHQRGLTTEAVKEAKGLGLTVYCWVLDMGGLAEVIRTGVDGVVVDSPDLARQQAESLT
jgi:glycerophosphoryl diester phosphodiesterase